MSAWGIPISLPEKANSSILNTSIRPTERFIGKYPSNPITFLLLTPSAVLPIWFSDGHTGQMTLVQLPIMGIQREHTSESFKL